MAGAARRALHRRPRESSPDRPTPVDVDAYLAELGWKPVLKAWQFPQAVDAIQKLFELASTEPSPSRRLLPKPVPAPRMHPIDPC